MVAEQYVSTRHWLLTVADTVMVVFDGNYKSKHKPFQWCQQVRLKVWRAFGTMWDQIFCFPNETFFWVLVSPILANIPILYPPENTRKPLVFCYFQRVLNGNIGQKLVNGLWGIAKWREKKVSVSLLFSKHLRETGDEVFNSFQANVPFLYPL